MISYKFCVTSSGALMCFRYGDGFCRFKGQGALDILEHIKDFSFYACNSITNKNKKNFTYDMQFTSNNHRVTFENVHNFKRKKEFCIENEIETLIGIVKKNKAIIAAEEKRKSNIFKEISTFATTLTLTAALLFASKNNMKVNKMFNNSMTNLTTTEYTSYIKGTSFTKSNIKSAYAEKLVDVALEEIDNENIVNTSTSNTNKIIIPGEEILENKNNLAIVPGEEIFDEIEEEQETTNIEEYVEDYYNEDLNATNISTAEIEEEEASALTNIIEETSDEYDGRVLNSRDGIVNDGPSGGKETYYNLNMDRVITNMRNQGFDEENYPYWVREDGVKMIGDYVMVAANLNVHPRGSLVPTTLGVGMVCDTGDFAKTKTLQLDIATNW